MKGFSRLACAALAVFLVNAAPQKAAAAFAPSGVGNALEKAAVPQVEQVRRGGGGRGFGMRGGGRHIGGFRGGPRWGHVGPRRHWGHRRGWGVGIGAPLGYYGYSCIRRGWVWNGYRHVWRRYRVC